MRPTRPSESISFFRLSWVAAAALCACCSGDRDGKEDVVEVSIVAGAVSFAPVAGGLAAPDARLCEKAAAEMMAKLPKIPLPSSSPSAPRLDVTGIWDSGGGEVLLSLEAKVRSRALRVPLGAHVAAAGRADNRQEEIALVSRGLRDLGKALSSLIALYGADEATWIRALDAAEADEQVLALSLLGVAKTRVAIPAIGLVLKDPRERVAETAADALVAIGDESAVPILIGAIGRNDVRSEVRAIEAISKIGGKEARAYLEMTALGHESPEVRALSQNALSRMSPKGSKTSSKTR